MVPSRSVSRTRVGVALGVLVLTLSACGLRIGDPPAPVPDASGSEQDRQVAAVAMERVLLASDLAPSSDVPDGLVDAARTYLDDLGGVWVPPPRDPDPSPTSPARGADNSELSATLVEAGDNLLGSVSDPDHGEAYGSMWLTLRAGLALVEGDEQVRCSQVCGAKVIHPDLAAALAGEEGDKRFLDLRGAVIEHAPELISVYDAMGYLAEIRAARADSEDQDALAASARELRLFAEHLAGETSGTASDPRLGAYRIDPGDLDESERELLDAAVTGWLTVLARTPEPQVAGDVLWRTYQVLTPDNGVELWPGLGEG